MRKPKGDWVAPPEVREAIAAYNAGAEVHGWVRCLAASEADEKRVALRLGEVQKATGLSGIDAFKLALTAIPNDDWMMGRIRTPGRKPYKLDINRLLSTGSGSGDVLTKLYNAAAGSTSKRNLTFDEEVAALRAKHPDIPIEEIQQVVNEARRARRHD